MQLADESEEVPDLKNKSYQAFKLSSQEWEKIELMRDVLQLHETYAITSINSWYFAFLGAIKRTAVFFGDFAANCLAHNPCLGISSRTVGGYGRFSEVCWTVIINFCRSQEHPKVVWEDWRHRCIFHLSQYVHLTIMVAIVNPYFVHSPWPER
jgi:hypothetical protein